MKKNILTSLSIATITFCSGCIFLADGSEAAPEKTARISAAKSINQCLTPEEKTAFNTRVLQTELMVAGLSCPEHQQNYNDFVKKYKGELAKQSEGLQSYF